MTTDQKVVGSTLTGVTGNERVTRFKLATLFYLHTICILNGSKVFVKIIFKHKKGLSVYLPFASFWVKQLKSQKKPLQINLKRF